MDVEHGLPLLVVTGLVGVVTWFLRQRDALLDKKHETLESKTSRDAEELRKKCHDLSNEIQLNRLSIERLEATSADKDSLHALETGIRTLITSSFAELEDRLGKRIDAAVKRPRGR